ncbi:tetraspanin-13b isoform X3 [Epinephelus moara]|uniref:tetraspanin-13b isoform X3 n=1 Tax=Epinephelus moara TaxID=300413 RepID=UPI00214EDBD8|nr:tetraspanin-13b isoform X3 [Epinephelus moara]
MWVASRAKHPRHTSPQQRFPAPPGGHQGVPRPDKMCNPSSVLWVYPGASYQWDVPGTPSAGGAQEDPSQMPEPPQMTPFDAKEQRLYSELPPDVRAPHPISKAEPSHPNDPFRRSYPQSHSFGHYPELMTIGEGWDVDGKLRIPAQLPLYRDGPAQRLHHCRSRTDALIHLTA